MISKSASPSDLTVTIKKLEADFYRSDRIGGIAYYEKLDNNNFALSDLGFAPAFQLTVHIVSGHH